MPISRFLRVAVLRNVYVLLAGRYAAAENHSSLISKKHFLPAPQRNSHVMKGDEIYNSLWQRANGGQPGAQLVLVERDPRVLFSDAEDTLLFTSVTEHRDLLGPVSEHVKLPHLFI
jgi:hypothetical protein